MADNTPSGNQQPSQNNSQQPSHVGGQQSTSIDQTVDQSLIYHIQKSYDPPVPIREHQIERKQITEQNNQGKQ